MWKQLPSSQRKLYKKLITNFASLSEAFAQKAQASKNIMLPIVNSKFQETAFQKSFKATEEDIGNTSYDASIDGSKKRFLVGIKTFGFNSGDQKIAQFKAVSANSWTEIIDKIRKNAEKVTNKKEVNNVNCKLYLELAKKIAIIRNKRIKSSEANIKGFKNLSKNSSNSNIEVEAVYHVLMPAVKNKKPKILVGETSYTPIDVENIKIDGCTEVKRPTNFMFHDCNHYYKYTSADSQLLMKFDNKKITVDEWSVTYVMDAFKFFENMKKEELSFKTLQPKKKLFESHSWYIHIEPYSGYNAFYGQSKMTRKNNYREKRIEAFEKEYSKILPQSDIDRIVCYLKKILLEKWKTKNDKKRMVLIRSKLINFVKKIADPRIKKDIENMVYRPVNELELRIPNSSNFHRKYPHFFVKNIFDAKSNDYIVDKSSREFKLAFLPSGDVINAYVNQENRKAIESLGSQGILGKWILRDIFQLKEYEPLTYAKLSEIGKNGIRFTKKDDHIELQFIWIDSENEPDDIWK